MRLKSLNFDIYKCREIKKSVADIELIWDVKSSEVTNAELKIIIKKLYKTNHLKNNDLIKLLSNILEVKNILTEMKLGDLEEFFLRLKNSFNKEMIPSRLKNVDIFYDTLLIFYKNPIIIDSIYYLANQILELKSEVRSNSSKKTELIFKLISSKKDVLFFFTREFLLNIRNYLKDIEIFEKEYYIGKSTNLFFDIISNILENGMPYILKNEGYEVNKFIHSLFKENIRDYSQKIEVYKKVINVYRDTNIKFNGITNIWFYEILETLGEIKPNNLQWNSFSEEEKSIFRRWFFGEKIDEFFGKKVRDPERTEFWKQYVHALKGIKFYKDIAEAIVMEFENHTIVEFGKKGNAAYVYPKSYLTISTVDSYLNMYSNTTIRDIKLKNQQRAIPLKISSATPGWKHPSNWQLTFKYRLRELGYR